MARSKALVDVQGEPEAAQEAAQERKEVEPTKLVCVHNNLTNLVTGTQYFKGTAVPVDPALIKEGAKSWENVQIAAGLLRVV